jgi:ferredoxin--NADP+ reductase
MFKVVEKRMLVPNIHLLKLESPIIANEVRPGQFVIVRADDEGERIPMSISDWDAGEGTITIVFVVVGQTTGRLAELNAGDSIPTVVGPLGNPTEICRLDTVACVGGCYGIGSIFPIARAFKKENVRVLTIIEARSSYLFYWEDRLKKVSDELIHITRDGTKGYKGHVGRLPEILKAYGQKVDRLIVNGCTYLLQRCSEASRPLGIKTIASLNPIMIDGTGMCGVCRVTVGGKTRFACVDGPDFDGHEIDWQELFQRRKTYLGEEAVSFRTSGCEHHHLKP